jgi:hypothetical protein
MLFILSLATGRECAAQSDSLKPVPDEIRFEACLPNENEIGRPLPLAGHWNTGQLPSGFTPDYQMAMIDQGHYLLPWFELPMPGESTPGDAYFQNAIKRAAVLNLPISFIATQWEQQLTIDPTYFNLPADQNPNVIGLDGTIQQEIDSMGPIDPWKAVGRMWTSNPEVQKIQAWYPKPPLVLFVSNNEANILQWTDAETSKRYVDSYGLGKEDNFKRQVIGKGWISRYRALQDGMRDGLGNGKWSEKAKFIGYDAFGGSFFARWSGWIDYSLYITGRIEPWPLAWDGASVSYYLENWCPITDYQVWSPQIESMNWIFMLNDTYSLNPEFWFELSIWDGDSTERQYFASLGQSYSTERYGGMVKFGMWLVRPRLVREFRMSTDTVANAGPYFMAVTTAVDSVHTSSVLRKFWRNGQLVANQAYQHPYQSNVPPEYQTVNRWFLLDTSLDPPRPWSLFTNLPVYSLALVLGRPPQREWLVYAFSPLGVQKNVRITLPDYGSITVDTRSSGDYFHVIECLKTVDSIDAPQQPPVPTYLRLLPGQ